MSVNVILELGCNHNGSFDIAKQMIDDAAKLGVKGVKIQKRDIDSIPDNVKCIKRDMSNSFGITYYEHRKVLEFNEQEICDLKKHAESQGLLFACSVFDVPSMEIVIEHCAIRFIKLPSQFLTNEKMNENLLQYNENPVYDLRFWHSTGMHTTQEIVDCKMLYAFDVTFYCRSMYPFETIEQLDIPSAARLYRELNVSFRKGYSSHDKDGMFIPLMVNLGAQWIERHYTLDKNMKGSDHSTVSSDFIEMKNILHQIEKVQECLYAEKLDPIEQHVRETYMGKDN